MDLETFVLLNEDKQQIVGTSCSQKDSNHVFVTVQSQGVYEYNLIDKKCVRSWLFGPSNTFTHHAVSNSYTKSFLAIIEQKGLVQWAKDDCQVQNLNEYTFKHEGNINCIIVHPNLVKNSILVFSSGIVGLFCQSEVIENQVECDKDKNHQVISVTFEAQCSDLNIYLITVSGAKENQTYFFHIFKYVNNSNVLVKLVSHIIPSEPKKSLLSTCACETTSKSLAVLWRDGTIEFYKFDNQKIYATNSICYVGSCKTELLSPLCTSVNSNGYILIASTNPDSNQARIMIWNPIYGVLQKAYNLNLNNIVDENSSYKKSKKINKHIRQLSVCPGGFLVTWGQSVIICSIYLPKPSLAQILGSDIEENGNPTISLFQGNFTEKQGIQNKKIPVGSQFDWFESLSWIDLENGGIGNEKIIQNLKLLEFEEHAISQLTDPQKTPEYTSFMEVFEDYISKATSYVQDNLIKFSDRLNCYEIPELQKKIKRDSIGKKDENLLENALITQVVFTPNFVNSVAKRCLKEDFLLNPLIAIIKSNSLTCQAVPELLPTLKDKNQFRAIASVLTHVSDVSEFDLVKILRWLLNDVNLASLELFVDEFDEREIDDTQINLQSRLFKYLNIVFTVPFSPLFLQRHIKLLDLKDVMEILKYMTSCFDSFWQSPSTITTTLMTNTNKKSYFSLPPLENVALWTNCVIDARLNELLIEYDCIRSIERLKTSLNKIINYFIELEQLKGCLDYYFDQNNSSKKEVLYDYSVEILKL